MVARPARRTVRSPLVRAFLAVIFTVLLLSVPVVAANADPVAEGLRFESDVTYRLEPDEERVRVTMEVALTNQTPDRGNMYFYFDRIAVPALREASNVSATSSGGSSLRVDVADAEEPILSVLTVWLPGQLRYGQTQRLTLTYDLPDQPPRSEGRTRATDAYASFDVFPFADPGLASVTVVVPDSYRVEVGGVGMSRETDGDAFVYSESGIEDPWEWWARFAARDDDLLDERSVELGGAPAVLRYWPGDDEWADFVEETAGEGVPVLEELTGLPWPDSRELEIVESSAPDAHGYLGWYNSAEHVVEVGDGLDAQLVLHELSHVWFNDELVEERWIAEGLAELYSHAALEHIEGSAPQAEEVDGDVEPLVSWRPMSGAPDESDVHAYRTAWWLFQEVHSEIGTEAMAEVLGAAAATEIPYRAGEPEAVPGRVDWRRVLDLLQEVGGSELAVELYEDHVLPDDDLDVLEDRSEARASYARLAEAGSGWAPPFELRNAMTMWQFSEVDDLVATAERVLDARAEIVAVTADLGVDELPALRDAYESARDVDALSVETAAYVDVAAALAEADEVAAGSGGVRGVLSRIGLTGARVPDRLADAASALGAGDLDGADAAAERALADAERSALVGGVVLVEVLAGAVLAFPLRRLARPQRRRGRRRRVPRVDPEPVGSASWSNDEPSSSPSKT